MYIVTEVFLNRNKNRGKKKKGENMKWTLISTTASVRRNILFKLLFSILFLMRLSNMASVANSFLYPVGI